MKQTLKYGVFSKGHTRESVKRGVLNTFHQYPGEFVISDGVDVIIIDDFKLEHLDEAQAVAYFAEEAASRAEYLADIKEIDPEIQRVPDDGYYFADSDIYPITYFDSFLEAKKHHKPAPENRDISGSTRVTLQ